MNDNSGLNQYELALWRALEKAGMLIMSISDLLSWPSVPAHVRATCNTYFAIVQRTQKSMQIVYEKYRKTKDKERRRALARLICTQGLELDPIARLLRTSYCLDHVPKGYLKDTFQNLELSTRPIDFPHD